MILIHCGSQNSKNDFQGHCFYVISSPLNVVGTYEYNEMSFSQLCHFIWQKVDYVSLSNYTASLKTEFSGLWQNKNLARFHEAEVNALHC